MASYTPPAKPIETTATVAPRSVAATPAPAPVAPPAQVAASGVTIIVGTSDTMDGLAHRYNVSAAAIMQANHMSGRAHCSRGSS